jgi:hypothetical protein
MDNFLKFAKEHLKEIGLEGLNSVNFSKDEWLKFFTKNKLEDRMLDI